MAWACVMSAITLVTDCTPWKVILTTVKQVVKPGQLSACYPELPRYHWVRVLRAVLLGLAELAPLGGDLIVKTLVKELTRKLIVKVAGPVERDWRLGGILSYGLQYYRGAVTLQLLIEEQLL